MASIKILILSLCLVAAVIHSGEAVQCYKCEGDPGGDCAKGVISSMQVVSCPGGTMGMCYHTDLRSGDLRTFDRGCTRYSNPDLCTLLYTLSAQNPIALRVFSCGICSGDKCNTGTTK